MADKIETKKLVKDLEEAVSKSKDLIKITEATNSLYIEMAKSVKTAFNSIDNKTTKGLSEFNKVLSTTNDILEKQDKNNKDKLRSEKDLETQEKKLLALQKKLNSEMEEGVDENTKLTIQLQEQAKAKKEAAKEALGLIDSYEKESKELRKMKKELKANVIEMRRLGKSEEEVGRATREVRKEISKLDRELRDLDRSVGDSYREIGKYEEALESLKSTAGDTGDFLSGLGLGTALAFGADKITDIAVSSREAELELSKLGAAAKASFDVLGANAETAAVDALRKSERDAAAKKNLNEVKELIAEQAQIAKRVGIENIFRSDEEVEAAEKKLIGLRLIREEEERLFEIYQDKEKQDIKFRNDSSTLEKIKETTEAYKLLAEETLLTSLYNNESEKILADINLLQQELSVASDDDTRSLEEQIRLKKELLLVNKEVAEVTSDIASNNLVIAAKDVAVSFSAKGIITSEEAKNASGEFIRSLLQDEEKAKKITSEKADAFTSAYVAAIQADTEAAATALETQGSLSKLLSDKYEKDLDILIDGADRLKAINEDIISDEGVSDLRRRKLFIETRKLMNDSFNEEVDVINKFTTERIDLNDSLSQSEKQILKEKVSKSNIESLIEAKTSKELNEKIRLLGLSEIFEGRALEVVVDRIQAKSDLAILEKELNKSDLKSLEIGEDIIEQEKVLAILNDDKIKTQEDLDAALDNLEKERVQNRIDAIDEELKLFDKGSLEATRLNKEKNDLLIQQDEEAAEKRIEIEEERADKSKKIADDYIAWVEKGREERFAKQKEIFEKGIEVIDEVLTRARERRNNELDKEIDGLGERESQIRDAINNGNTDAQSSLAEIQKKQAEAEKEKERLRKKEVRDKILIAGLESFVKNDGNVGKTLADVAILVASMSAIPSFFDGTENTGVGGKIDNKNGFHAVLHPNERVMTAKENAPILKAGLSNQDVSDLVSMHASGDLNGGTTVLAANNKELVGKLESIENAIKSQQVPSYNYDANAKYHEQVLDSKNKREIIKIKANNIFK